MTVADPVRSATAAIDILKFAADSHPTAAHDTTNGRADGTLTSETEQAHTFRYAYPYRQMTHTPEPRGRICFQVHPSCSCTVIHEYYYIEVLVDQTCYVHWLPAWRAAGRSAATSTIAVGIQLCSAGGVDYWRWKRWS